MNTMKLFRLKWGALVLFLISGNTMAECPAADLSTDLTFSFPSPLVVPRDAYPGQVLAEAEVSLPEDMTDCGPFKIKQLQGSDEDAGIYSTNIEGIGYQIWAGRTILNPLGTGGSINPVSSFRMKLMKTTKVMTTAGSMGPLHYATLETPNGYTINLKAGDIQVKAATCSFLQPEKTVTLDTVESSRFSGIGSVAGDIDFTVAVECNARIADVSQIFDGTAALNTTTAQGVLNLLPGSTAQGVGVQVLLRGGNGMIKPLSFGKPIYRVSQAWPIAGIRNITLTARYYQTENQVTAGSVRAQGTFRITYQ